MYLSSFLPAKRDARLHLPFSGSLGSHFPTFPALQLLGHRYYDPLRLPLLHLGSLRFSLASRYLAFSHFRSLAFRAGEFTRQRLAVLIFRFAYPGIRRKEMAVLSSSQTTPVCACPARRPRWCPLDLPSRLKDSCLPLHPERRLSPTLAGLSHRTTSLTFSELSHAAYALATPGFTHTLSAMHAGSLQFWRLTFSGWELGSFLPSPTG